MYIHNFEQKISEICINQLILSEWAKKLEASLPLGRTVVTFTALSPAHSSAPSASCSFTIHVRDSVPPRVYNCPKDFRAYLDRGQTKRQVS